MELRFGTYNLEFGGIDHGGSAARLNRQLALLADQHADVWAFQECSGWAGTRTRHAATVEEALGMRGYLCDGAHGFPLAVFVSEPAGIHVTETRHEERTPYWHGVAHVVAEVPGHGTIRFASAHLAPSSPAGTGTPTRPPTRSRPTPPACTPPRSDARRTPAPPRR